MRATDTGGTGLSLQKRRGQMLVELLRKEALQTLAEYVRECVLVEGRHVCDGDIRMQVVQLGTVNARFCHTLSDYERLPNRIKISKTGVYVLHEQRMYATHEFGAKRKTMNSFMLIRDESDYEKETWVREVLFLLRCVVGGG